MPGSPSVSRGGAFLRLARMGGLVVVSKIIEGLHSHRHSIPALCHGSLWWCRRYRGVKASTPRKGTRASRAKALRNEAGVLPGGENATVTEEKMAESVTGGETVMQRKCRPNAAAWFTRNTAGGQKMR
jgi:hypothetical protein